MADSKYGKYIVNTLDAPHGPANAAYHKNVLHIDDKVVDGAFAMNCAWYLNTPTDPQNSRGAHYHDADEILGFFGGNPAEANELGAEIEFWLEDEMHIITRSSLIFIPKGLKHCPLVIRRVDKPVFHFGIINGNTTAYSV